MAKNSFVAQVTFKDTNFKKNQALAKSTDIDIWEIGELNWLSIRGSYIQIKFSKKSDKTVFFVIHPFCLFFLTLVFERALLYGNVVLSKVVLLTKKLYSSFSRKAFIL